MQEMFNAGEWAEDDAPPEGYEWCENCDGQGEYEVTDYWSDDGLRLVTCEDCNGTGLVEKD
jgi:DnaJ-class molecular chaperone